MTSPAIGIDLGTTYSCVAVFQNGKVEIIANDQGNRTTPSYVAFTDSERLIGEVAKSQTIRNPQNTVFDVKRIIGRPFSDPAVTGELKRWPFKVVNDNNTPIIQVEYRNQPRRFRPEEISAMVLSKMKETAEACLGQVVTEAVITVPAYFNNQQRTATKDAARIAGLQVKRMINEPTAAALAYGLDKCTTGVKNVLVFDLGGGTIDVSILKITKGPSFDVLATSGDTHLGGQDFDNRMVKHFAEEFHRKHNQDISKSATAMQKLKVACEQAKRSLSTTTKAFIEIDSLFQGKHFNSEITRARFEKLCMDLFTRTLDCVEQALKDARMDKGAIDDVVLVGGSTRIPKVQKLLREFFNGKHLNKNVHPDEAVAYGAALQAAAVCSNSSEPPPKFILRDVLPLSIGVEVGGISMMRMVDRNTPIPVRRSNTFVLGRDNQDAAGVRVLEGERVLTAHCSIIGEFELSGLVPRRREEPGIKITFDVDADGILTVSAEDVRSDKAKSIVITDSAGRISESEVKRMIREAEVFRTEDVSLRERVAMKGDIEAFLLTARRRVEEAEGRVSVQDAELVFNTFSEVMNWLDRNKLAEKYELVSLKKDTEDKINPVLERIARSEGAGQSQASSHRGGVPHFAGGGYPQANRGGGTGRGTRPQEHFGRGDDDFLGPSLGGPRGTRGTRPQEHFGRDDDDFLGPSLGGPRGTRGTRPQEHFGRGDDDFLGPSLGGPRGTRETRPQEHFGRGDDDFLGPSLGGLGSFGPRRSSVEPDEQPDAATTEDRGPVADVMNELD